MSWKVTYLTVALLCLASMATGQSAFEALRYSQINPGGTARGLAVGGAFGAVGADYTGVVTNPGALGVYRNSEVMATLQVPHTTTSINFAGVSFEDQVTRGAIGNVGVVFSKLHQDQRGNRRYGNWVATNFSVGFNRLADFNTNRYFKDENARTSYLAGSRNELNAEGLTEAFITTDNFDTRTVGFYNTYLLNPTEQGGSIYSAVTDANPFNQQTVLRTRGGIDELSLSVAANYNDKFYFGGSVGLPFLRYEQDLVVTEADDNDLIKGFQRMALEEGLSTTGVGINAKFGFIARVHKFVRLGASIHTPTLYNLNDVYSSNFSSSIDSLGRFEDFYSGEFQYRLSTPARFIGSAAVFFNRYGFFTLDYEYTDMRWAKYKFEPAFDAVEGALNNDIDAELTAMHTLRTGLEFAIKKFRVRGGYSFSTSPISNAAAGADYMVQSFSGGVGVRLKRFYIDAAYVRSMQETSSTLADGISVNNQINRGNVVLTAGFNF